MSVLFAIGVAYGMSKDNDGAAALAGFVGYMVITTLCSPGAVEQIGLVSLDDPTTKLAFAKIGNQFIGILIGIVTAEIYNRFSTVELPKALAFFSGKRLVPILVAATSIAISFVLMYVWPMIFGGWYTSVKQSPVPVQSVQVSTASSTVCLSLLVCTTH